MGIEGNIIENIEKKTIYMVLTYLTNGRRKTLPKKIMCCTSGERNEGDKD